MKHTYKCSCENCTTIRALITPISSEQDAKKYLAKKERKDIKNAFIDFQNRKTKTEDCEIHTKSVVAQIVNHEKYYDWN